MAVSMDCMVSVQNKRRHEVEKLGKWENLNQPTKRFCGGLESCIQFDNAAASVQLGECPMDTWNTQQPVSSNDPQRNQHSSMVYATGSGSVQPCLRCMAGESGHINHIMDF